MNKDIIVSASTCPPPLSDLVEYCKDVSRCGADWIHCDIMDGKFVENKTFDNIVLSLLTKHLAQVTMDVHLMAVEPEKFIKPYAKAGANILTVHYEALNGVLEMMDIINQIHEVGCKAGISINPDTPVESIAKILPFVDLVLVMSVQPGKGGQTFIPSTMNKILALNNIRKDLSSHFLIEVDGGVNIENAPRIINSGADVLVIGQALYMAKNKTKFLDTIKGRQ